MKYLVLMLVSLEEIAAYIYPHLNLYAYTEFVALILFIITVYTNFVLKTLLYIDTCKVLINRISHHQN